MPSNIISDDENNRESSDREDRDSEIINSRGRRICSVDSDHDSDLEVEDLLADHFDVFRDSEFEDQVPVVGVFRSRG